MKFAPFANSSDMQPMHACGVVAQYLTSMEMGRGNQRNQVTWESDRTAAFSKDISILLKKAVSSRATIAMCCLMCDMGVEAHKQDRG
jgi:hypothetical protein